MITRTSIERNLSNRSDKDVVIQYRVEKSQLPMKVKLNRKNIQKYFDTAVNISFFPILTTSSLIVDGTLLRKKIYLQHWCIGIRYKIKFVCYLV